MLPGSCRVWYIPAMTLKPLPATKKNVPAMLADTDMLFKQAKQGSEPFRQAKPFPHVLLPGMIKASCRVALCEGLRQWQPDSHPGFYPQGELPSVVHLLLWELSSSTLIRHFASLAGTAPLLPDPFLVGAGPGSWPQEGVIETSDKDSCLRHPQTDLQNAIRLEIFVADDPQLMFPLQLVCADQPGTFYSVNSGTALITTSNNYRMTLRSSAPQRWQSLVSYFYINDRASTLGEATERNQESVHGY